MKVTIVKPDNVVGVDGVFIPIDLTDMPSNLRVVQWDGDSGHVEWTDKNNTKLVSFDAYQPIVALWQAAHDEIEAKKDPYYGLDAQGKAAKILKQQKDAIAAQRYAVEVSGVKYKGKTIPTDRESQQMLDSTCEKIRRGLIASVDWKCDDGYITLTPENITEIEVLVLTHVQTAFALEKLQIEALEQS